MTTTATITVDLGALCDNWRTLAARAPKCETAAVIKADGYGLGMVPVAQALHKAGCKTFFVAHAQEAFALRDALPDPVIYVLHGTGHADAKEFAARYIRPVLNTMDEIARWADAVTNNDPGACIHVDTGMSRLGVSPDELAKLAAKPLPFKLSLLQSHFVESETPDAAITKRQIEDFARLRPFFADVPASLANSSGVYIDAAHYDVNRTGYAMYGGNPTPYTTNPMKPVVTLTAPLLQTRTVPAGTSAGYCATFTAKRETRLATYALGYADGWLRSGSNKAKAIIGGVLCPLVGNISMDLIIADVTDVPPDKVDAATLIGGELTVDAVAASQGTIGYEVLTRLGKRLPRTYING